MVAAQVRTWSGNLRTALRVFDEAIYRVTLEIGQARAETTVSAGPARRVDVTLTPE